jgi:hypothetical protein
MRKRRKEGEMVARSRQPASYSVHYGFSQRFEYPARDAYEWSMDYRTDDMERMGKKGSRRIERINEDTLVLTDTFFPETGRRITKRRLIRMFPELLTMVNTRLSSDGLHSQFIYAFVDEAGGKSRLDFTGSQVFCGEKPAPSKIASLASEMAKEDSAIWVALAGAMREDLGPRNKAPGKKS